MLAALPSKRKSESESLVCYCAPIERDDGTGRNRGGLSGASWRAQGSCSQARTRPRRRSASRRVRVGRAGGDVPCVRRDACRQSERVPFAGWMTPPTSPQRLRSRLRASTSAARWPKTSNGSSEDEWRSAAGHGHVPQVAGANSAENVRNGRGSPTSSPPAGPRCTQVAGGRRGMHRQDRPQCGTWCSAASAPHVCRSSTTSRTPSIGHRIT